jgi:putative ABC transport system permease protein
MLRFPLMLVTLIYQSISLAAGQLWANKLRAALTTLGIVIGVASVSAVIAALTGLKTQVLSEFENFGTNKLFVFADRPDSGPDRNLTWSQIRLKPEEFDGMLQHCPSVSSFTRVVHTMKDLSAGGQIEHAAPVVGIEPSWHSIENRHLIMGRPFSVVDEDQNRAVCIINTTTRDKLQLDRDPTGQYMLLGDRRFLIIGLLEKRPESGMFGGGGSQAEVFIPFSTGWEMQRDFARMYVIAASKSPELSEDAKAEINFYLTKKRRIQPGRWKTWNVEAIEQFVQQFMKVSSAITMVAAGVVGISLVVGGVGIMNIMLVSVSERTREIGLRKAVGAPPSAILLQFLIEAVVLCLLGGFIGLAVGQGLVSGIARIPNAQLGKAYIPAWAVALALGFSGGVGLIFGMFPAIKAARLDPIEALRHE